jgi:hypothetical protein
MSLKINIENYEAYYLDFLEGNLNEVDMFEFSDFLKQHPELKIEEDILDFKLVPTEKLDKSYLNELKVFDESESICENNYEYFMISSIEKQLNSSKEIELQDFISKNKIYQNEYNLYQKSRLKADLTQVFEDKKSLKQAMVIPMYYKLISIAATVILALLLIPFSKNSFHEIESSRYVSSKFKPNKLKNKILEHKLSLDDSLKSKISKNHQVLTLINKISDSENNKTVNLSEFDFGRIALLKIVPFVPEKTNQEILYFDEIAFTNNKNQILLEKNNEINSYLAFDEMKNPVPIVTNGLKSKINRDIDFRTAKATNKKQGGFFLKLGKLEISRKTSPVDVLAIN